MSRSHKKNPFYKALYHNKKEANRRYRRAKKQELRYLDEDELCGGRSDFKKYTDTWDLYAYISYWPKSRAIARYKKDHEHWDCKKYQINNVEDYLNKIWEPYYRRK